MYYRSVKRSLGGRGFLANYSKSNNVGITRFTKSIGLFFLSLSLGACISTSTIDVPSQDPVEVEDRAIVDGQPLPLPLPDDNVIKAESLSGEAPMSPVVKRVQRTRLKEP